MGGDAQHDVRELNCSDLIHEEISGNPFEIDDDMKPSWKVTNIEQQHQFSVEVTILDQTDAPQTCSQNMIDGPPPSAAGKVTRRMEVGARKTRSIREGEFKSASGIDNLICLPRVRTIADSKDVYSMSNATHRDIHIDDLDDRKRVFPDFDFSFASACHQALRLRSGTILFLAWDIFDHGCTSKFRHHYDVESFLYVLLWHACDYRQAQNPPKKDVLREWRKDSWKGTRMMKFLFTSGDWMESFPVGIPGEGHLREHCLRLCDTYGEVMVKAQLARVAVIRSELPFRKEISTLPPDPNEEHVVTFRLWVESTGFEDDAEVCDQDCCVYSE